MSAGRELIKYVEEKPPQEKEIEFIVGIDFAMDNSITVISTKGKDGWYYVGYNYVPKETKGE